MDQSLLTIAVNKIPENKLLYAQKKNRIRDKANVPAKKKIPKMMEGE